MFGKKYTVSILNSKWIPLKRDMKISFVPRPTEYIYMDNQYFSVLNVVHMLGKKQDIFIIVNETTKQPNNNSTENQILTETNKK